MRNRKFSDYNRDVSPDYSKKIEPPLSPIAVLRTSPPFYWFMVGIPALVLILSASGIAKSPSFWPPTFMMAAMVIVLFLWGKTATLTLTNDSIHYRSLLKLVDIALLDVIKLNYAFGFVTFYRPYQRIVIKVRENGGKKEITLNAGLFNQREIKQWVKACNSIMTNNKKPSGHPLKATLSKANNKL